MPRPKPKTRLEGWELARAVQRREPRSTRRKKARAKITAHEHSPFGYELYLLHRGALIVDVLDSLCGTCSRGRAWKASFMAALEHLQTAKSRRKALEHWLRTFERAKVHRGVWMVRGADGYVGRDHFEAIDPETGEFVLRHFPAAKGGKPKSQGGMGGAGELAVRSKRCPRQLRRYRACMRDSAMPVWRTRRQTHRDPDAVLPKRKCGGATWAYAEHFLPLDPAPEMLRRWGVDPGPQQHDLPGVDPFLPAQIIAHADMPERVGAMLEYVLVDRIPY